MPQDKFHALEEFGNFPWDKVDGSTGLTIGGRFGSNGEINMSNKPSIAFYSDNGGEFVEDRWEIPVGMQTLLESYIERGKQDENVKIRRALGTASLDTQQLDYVEDALSSVNELLGQYDFMDDHEQSCDPDCSEDSPHCEQMRLRRLQRNLKQIVNPDPSSIWEERLSSFSERVYYEEFCKEHKRQKGLNGGMGLMDHLISGPSDRKCISDPHQSPVTPTIPEIRAAAAFAQWLGTNCGQGYLSKCANAINEARKDQTIFRSSTPEHSGHKIDDTIESWCHLIIAANFGFKKDDYSYKQANRQLNNMLRILVGCILWLYDARKYADVADKIAGINSHQKMQEHVGQIIGRLQPAESSNNQT